MTKVLPSPDYLRKILRYDPETGKLFWREREPSDFLGGRYSAERACIVWNAKHAGREALASPNELGYLCGRIHRKLHRAHRVIWAMEKDAWPDGEIDHRNGIPSDNRMENLRVATARENARNQRTPASNTSGYKGVSFRKGKGVWLARLRIDGGRIWQKEFPTKETAAEAIVSARRKFHGDFARHA